VDTRYESLDKPQIMRRKEIFPCGNFRGIKHSDMQGESNLLSYWQNDWFLAFTAFQSLQKVFAVIQHYEISRIWITYFLSTAKKLYQYAKMSLAIVKEYDKMILEQWFGFREKWIVLAWYFSSIFIWKLTGWGMVEFMAVACYKGATCRVRWWFTWWSL